MSYEMEEKIYCPHCRCEIDDIELTSCPKCWGELVPAEPEEKPEQKKEPEAQETLQQPTTNETQKPASVSAAKKEIKEEKKCLCDTYNYIALIIIAILLCVQVYYLAEINSSMKVLKKEITLVKKAVKNN